jgi:poly(A) polymerase Pap1
LKRACIPIFLGRSAGRFLSPEGTDLWDCVILVRYRSRRDFLDMCADLAKDRADIHKWAAIEKTQVFPVNVRFSLSIVRLVVAGTLALIVLLVCLWSV